MTTVPDRRAHLPYNPTFTLNQVIEESIQKLDPNDLYAHPNGLSIVSKDEERLHSGLRPGLGLVQDLGKGSDRYTHRRNALGAEKTGTPEKKCRVGKVSDKAAGGGQQVQSQAYSVPAEKVRERLSDSKDEIMPYTKEYIDLVNNRLLSQRTRSKSRKGKQQKAVDFGVEHSRYAITTFVQRTESSTLEPIEDIDQPPPAHEIVVSVLERPYEGTKQQQQQQAITAATATTKSGNIPFSTEQEFGAPMKPLGSPKRKRSLKRQERRMSWLRQRRKRKPKHKKWCTAKTDKDKRYSVRKVTIAEAKIVDPDEAANSSSSSGSASCSSSKTSLDATSSKASAKAAPRKPRKKLKKLRKPKTPAPAQTVAFAGTFATST
ncbi:hypothetical protein BGZ47_002602 [Haplosporangium gracile]|nr:hypothetical protein BGZ47_002602 [Haplosporangium gracile]